ncbi:MAG: hypothetical protein K6F17_03255 [Lachnospiraceae bacterium]|nr:hypothetical protein [Lachnospiraceae bacterium]
MIVQHNLSAMNTNRNLRLTGKRLARNSERLSSGLKLNRAADDAAGLTISEKMRWQIRGLDKSSVNAQEGIAMIQVADGALSEVHDMLHRMEEIATQAANDTNTDADREALGKELTHLQSEINRISKTTTYNTYPVLEVPQLVNLEGGSGTGKMDTLVNVPGIGNKYASVMDFTTISADNKSELVGKSFTVSCSANCNQVFTFAFNDGTTTEATVSGTNLTVAVGLGDESITSGGDITSKIYDAVVSKQSEITGEGGAGVVHIGHANGIASDNGKLIMYSISGGPNYSPGMGMVSMSNMITESYPFNLQIGALEGQSLSVDMKTVNTATLGINALDVSSYETAGESITAIHEAVAKVSDHRAYLGAIQNRLEHTIRNLQATSEKTSAAESLIRDTDMAGTMVEYSKDNILAQAGQSMLAQANQQNQGVTNLLG